MEIVLLDRKGKGLRFFYLNGLAAIGKAGAANFALQSVTSAGGAAFASIRDDLQVQIFPVIWMIEFFEVFFGLNHIFSRG